MWGSVAAMPDAAATGLTDKWGSFVFLVHRGQVLLAQTRGNPELWNPIGGRSDAADAGPLDTLLREVQEEIGVDLAGAALRPLGAHLRDQGTGLVHVWWLDLAEVPQLHVAGDEFVAPPRWFSVEEALELPMFGVAKRLLRRVAADLGVVDSIRALN